MAGNTTINTDDRQHGTMLERIGRRAMLERGLLPDFTLPVMADLDAIQISAAPAAQSGQRMNLLARPRRAILGVFDGTAERPSRGKRDLPTA